MCAKNTCYDKDLITQKIAKMTRGSGMLNAMYARYYRDL
jgi:hypothetical protein